jgi:hypothetical protein
MGEVKGQVNVWIVTVTLILFFSAGKWDWLRGRRIIAVNSFFNLHNILICS